MHRITLLLILFIDPRFVHLLYVHCSENQKHLAAHCALDPHSFIDSRLLPVDAGHRRKCDGSPCTSHRKTGYLHFLFAIPKTIFMICSLVGLPFHYLLRWPRSPFTAVGLVLGVVSFFNILYGTLVGISKFEVKDIEFHHPNLPKAFDGYRIVQLSDIHIGSWIDNEKTINELVELVNAQKPDLIVFTGDLVNQRSCELEGFQDILAQLHAKDGVYSILGNHDYGSYYHWKT